IFDVPVQVANRDRAPGQHVYPLPVAVEPPLSGETRLRVLQSLPERGGLTRRRIARPQPLERVATLIGLERIHCTAKLNLERESVLERNFQLLVFQHYDFWLRSAANRVERRMRVPQSMLEGRALHQGKPDIFERKCVLALHALTARLRLLVNPARDELRYLFIGLGERERILVAGRFSIENDDGEVVVPIYRLVVHRRRLE